MLNLTERERKLLMAFIDEFLGDKEFSSSQQVEMVQIYDKIKLMEPAKELV